MAAVTTLYKLGRGSDGLETEPRRRMTPVAEQARLADMLRVMHTAAEPACPTDQRLAIPVWCLRKDAALFHEGSPSENLYVVRSGSFKCTKSSEDGYHQVLSFAGPGEVLGYESLYRGQQRTSAIALEVSTVYALPVHGLEALRQQSPAFDHALQFAISRQLDRAGDMAELMAAVAADARLSRFLLWLSARMAEAGQSPLRLRLRMCRRDIASLLGVAHETVSRSFTNLADEGLVRVLNRDVDILDPEGLRDRARSTRGLSDEPAPAAAPVCLGASRMTLPRATPRSPMPPRMSWFPGVADRASA